jgi:hypothetical protein
MAGVIASNPSTSYFTGFSFSAINFHRQSFSLPRQSIRSGAFPSLPQTNVGQHWDCCISMGDPLQFF